MPSRSGANLVSLTTAVVLKIKVTIAEDIKAGIPREKTFQKLKKLLERYGKTISDDQLRAEFQNAIAKQSVQLYDKVSQRMMNIAILAGVTVAKVAEIAAGGAVSAARSGKQRQVKQVTVGSENGADVKEFLYEDRIPLEDARKKMKQELDRMIRELAKQDIKGEDGRSLRARAEMHVRYDAQQESIAQMRQNGVKLVWASTHIDCSPRCAPWQGKLYSLDGTRGKTANGIAYRPLEDATNIRTPNGKWYNGLLGFNCRHRLIPYNERQQPPKGYSRAETTKHYNLDKKQRTMEVAIRAKKELAHLVKVFYPQHARQLFDEAAEMVQTYRKFCTQNDLVAMIYRTQVTVEEQGYNLKS